MPEASLASAQDGAGDIASVMVVAIDTGVAATTVFATRGVGGAATTASTATVVAGALPTDIEGAAASVLQRDTGKSTKAEEREGPPSVPSKESGPAGGTRAAALAFRLKSLRVALSVQFGERVAEGCVQLHSWLRARRGVSVWRCEKRNRRL